MEEVAQEIFEKNNNRKIAIFPSPVFFSFEYYWNCFYYRKSLKPYSRLGIQLFLNLEDKDFDIQIKLLRSHV